MVIEYKNINIYQGDKLILENVNFHVEEGEFIYIIGKVGSGKSSILKTTYGEVDIKENNTNKSKAEILGRNLTKIKRKDIPALRREMGIIFQDFQLLHDKNIYNNLKFVLKATGWKNNKDINNRILNVLSEVGMQDKLYNMPHELSGGEKQRIAIARSILNHPKIIIADEPTGNLDPDTAEGIVQLLRERTKTGTSVVMTTHNISMINKYPGIIYKCDNQQIKDITQVFNIDDQDKLNSLNL